MAEDIEEINSNNVVEGESQAHLIPSSPTTSTSDTDISLTLSPSISTVYLLPITPCKSPSAPPSTPCEVPKIVYTPTEHTPTTPATPATPAYSTAPSSYLSDTPSSRTRLLSKPLWQNSAARLSRTLRRAASFASFGERSNIDAEVEASELTRRLSEEPSRRETEQENTKLQVGITVGSIIVTPDPSPTQSAISAPTTAAEFRTSVMSTGSELSAQWFRTPRERLGLYLTVTKRGFAPWEKKQAIVNETEENHGTAQLVEKRGWRRFWRGGMRKP
jgi:hypothetical protein